MSRVQRIDTGRVVSAIEKGSIRRTPSGGIIVPATVTRSGVLAYLNRDGTQRFEYRPPDEVSRADSLATLEAAPVTAGHPREQVSPRNWKQVAVGQSAGPAAYRDDGHVSQDLSVQDAGTVERIDSGDLGEISCGYSCTLDWTEGVLPDGTRYDAIQRDIRYNHIALVPPNGGRAGKSVALRLDAQDNVTQDEDTEMATETKTIVKVRLDGQDFEVGSTDHVRFLENKIERAEARADKAEADLAKATERADAAEAVDVNALAIERQEILDLARVHLGSDYRADGASNEDMLRAAASKAFPGQDLASWNLDRIRGRLEGFTAAGSAGSNAARNDAVNGGRSTTNPVAAARAKAEAESRAASTAPIKLR